MTCDATWFEALAVPTEDSDRFHDDEGAGAVRPQPMKGNPEDVVLSTESGSFLSPHEDGQLLTQGGIFQSQGRHAASARPLR